MIKFAIFDVGQVCYPYSLNPLNKLMQQETNNSQKFIENSGIKSFDYKPFMRGEINFMQFCMNLCNHCGVTYSPDINVKIDKSMHDGVGDFFPETLQLMDKLRQKNITIGLLSNALPNLSDTAKNLTDKKNIFTSYELGLLKPDIKIYQVVLQKLNAKPQEVIFIDDKQTNVEAAKLIGIHGIVFDRNTIEQKVEKVLKYNNINHWLSKHDNLNKK